MSLSQRLANKSKSKLSERLGAKPQPRLMEVDPSKRIQESIRRVGAEAPDPLKQNIFETDDIKVIGTSKTPEQLKSTTTRTPDDIQKEIMSITRKPKQTQSEIDRVRELNQEFLRSQAREKPFGAGIAKGITAGVQPKLLEKISTPETTEAFKEAEKTTPFKVGEVLGKAGLYGGAYSLGGGAITGGAAPSLGAGGVGAATGTLAPTLSQRLAVSAGTGALGTLTGELAKDVTIGTGIGAIEAATGGRNVGQEIAENVTFDIVANLVFAGAGKVIKGLSELRQSGATEQVAKQLNIDAKKADKLIDTVVKKNPDIAKELGLEGVSAEDFLKTQERVAKDIEVEEYYKQFDKTPQQVTDDFNTWRKENFGGAFGKTDADTEQALKELYLETTGIDVDVALRESLEPQITGQRQQLEALRRPQEVSPTTIEPPKPVEVPQITKEADLTEVDKSILEEINKINIETNMLKEKIQNSNFGIEEKSRRLKTIGMEQAAKKRKLIQGDSFNEVEGGLTPKELSKKIAKERTNYKGKSVITPFGEGNATGRSAFGRVEVEFPDGSKKYIDSIDVKPKTTVEELISKTKKEEIKKIESPKPIEQTKTIPQPVDISVGKPREAEFKTPEVGVSEANFIETARRSDDTTAELTRRIKDLELATTSNEARTELAKQVVKENFETAVRMVKEGDQFGSAIEPEIGRDLISKLQVAGRDAEAVEIIESLAKKFRRAGQDVQAASIWSKNTPEGMQKWATNTLSEANVKVEPKLISEVGDDIRMINKMTPQELAEAISKRLGKAGEKEAIQNQILSSNSFEELKAMNTALTMNKVFEKIPVVKARKLSTIQAMSHLLNGRTFLRNIFGNTASIAGEMTSRIPASIADRGISMFTGNRSVIAKMPPWKKALNEGFREGKKSFFEITAGVSKGKQSKYDLLFGSAFKSRLGKGLEKTMSVSLQTPDEFFKGFTKADSVYNQVRARLGKEVDKMSFDEIMGKATREEIETAVKEAEFATFQNDSGLADFMSKTKSHLNRLHLDTNKKLFKEVGEFGLGDLTLKYTRVPGNIITRGFEYSPLGYTKAAASIFDLATTGKNISPQTQRELAMQIGRATTGTGLIALGMKLNDLGIISGADDSKDYDVNAFNQAEGLGNYKINTSALGRLIKGESTEKQSGDTIKSYNWAAPMTTPIAVGARLSAEKPGNPKDALKSLSEATWEEAVDLPTMFIIKKMMYEGMRDDTNFTDILSVPAKEALPGFVPSIVRQTAQAIDPVIRETRTGESPFTDKIKANIPALPFLPKKYTSKGLPAKFDPLGREMKRTSGPIGSLLDPATTTTYEPTDYGDKIRTISELTNETKVFPDRKPPNSFKFNKEVLNLTQEEKQLWQETEGKYVDEMYSRYLKDKEIKTQEQAISASRVLAKIKSDGSTKAKREVLKARGN